MSGQNTRLVRRQLAHDLLRAHREGGEGIRPMLVVLRTYDNEEQHEIEGILNHVGHSFGTCSLARGAHHTALVEQRVEGDQQVHVR